MPITISHYILQHGYLAVFLLIFLQEIGVPNPVSNELVLLFSGYLASIQTFSFIIVFLIAAAADFTGTLILFLVFYFFGKYIIQHKPKWIPISHEKIESITTYVSKKGVLSIFIGRLIPFLRGYTSVAAGLLRVKPHIFTIIASISAVIWSGSYVFLGWKLGPYWQKVADKMGGMHLVLLVIGAVVLFFLIKKLVKLYNNIQLK